MGMSVGATTLAAVTADRAITRRPALTLFRDRPSQVGTPAENSALNADFDDQGLVVTDFVDRVGDPEPVVATDGSTHRAEQLLADALHALANAATEGLPIPPAVAVAYPGHWSAQSVAALRTALARVADWAQHPVTLVPDYAAALTALRVNPGLPDHGVIAVCDFGGSGTSITLVDAARDDRPLGATRRSTAFSGDMIDQALLDHVLADLGGNGDGPATVGSLPRLRSLCRDAKDQLSADTVAELAGFHGGVWLTRAELDETLREPLDDFFALLRDTLDDARIRRDAFAAIVSVGGGANMPSVTTGLSQRFGVAVISSPRPQLTAAIGAALAVAGTATTATATDAPSAPEPPIPAAATAPVELESAVDTEPNAAWTPLMTPDARRVPAAAPKPAAPELPESGGVEWFRRPSLVVLVAALVTLLIGTVGVLVLRRASHVETDSGETTTVSSTTAPSPPQEPPPIVSPPAEPDAPPGGESPSAPQSQPDTPVAPELPVVPESPAGSQVPEPPAPASPAPETSDAPLSP